MAAKKNTVSKPPPLPPGTSRPKIAIPGRGPRRDLKDAKDKGKK